MILNVYNTCNKQITVSQTMTWLSVVVKTTLTFLPCFKLQKKPLKETLPHSRQQGHRPRTANKKCITLISCQSFKAHAGVFKKLWGFVQ